MGASRERVNYIARVEDVKTILDSTQVRYLARCATITGGLLAAVNVRKRTFVQERS